MVGRSWSIMRRHSIRGMRGGQTCRPEVQVRHPPSMGTACRAPANLRQIESARRCDPGGRRTARIASGGEGNRSRVIELKVVETPGSTPLQATHRYPGLAGGRVRAHRRAPGSDPPASGPRLVPVAGPAAPGDGPDPEPGRRHRRPGRCGSGAGAAGRRRAEGLRRAGREVQHPFGALGDPGRDPEPDGGAHAGGQPGRVSADGGSRQPPGRRRDLGAADAHWPRNGGIVPDGHRPTDGASRRDRVARVGLGEVHRPVRGRCTPACWP